MVMLIDRPDMTLDVYRGRKRTTTQQQQLTYFAALGYKAHLCNLLLLMFKKNGPPETFSIHNTHIDNIHELVKCQFVSL